MQLLDQAIVSQLQRDSRQPFSDIADSAGLSLSACHRRIKLLEMAGVIEGYGARLNAKALGLEIEVFAEISLVSQHHSALEKFERAVLRHDEILECKLTTGASDYILRVIARRCCRLRPHPPKRALGSAWRRQHALDLRPSGDQGLAGIATSVDG